MQVLITDTDPASAITLGKALQEWGHEVEVANDMPAILSVLQSENTPLIGIIDCTMPGLDGLDVFRTIRATVRHRSVYLILLTTHDDPTFLADALEAGANNCITRTTSQADLRICIETGRRRLELEEAVVARSTRDPQTGLYNRNAVMEKLKKEMERCQREQAPLSIVFADLDGLQQINDCNGHSVGDTVLREISDRLGAKLRSYDRLGRWGGDELVMILPKCDTTGAREVAKRARMAVAGCPIRSEAGELVMALTSVTATVSGEKEVAPHTLMQIAETAMVRAKEAGGNRVGTASMQCSPR